MLKRSRGQALAALVLPLLLTGAARAQSSGEEREAHLSLMTTCTCHHSAPGRSSYLGDVVAQITVERKWSAVAGQSPDELLKQVSGEELALLRQDALQKCASKPRRGLDAVQVRVECSRDIHVGTIR